MFRFCVILMATVTVVCGVPFEYSCIEDSQCSEDFFCNLETYLCRECLDCHDLGRNDPETIKKSGIGCIRSGADCGLCFNGLVYHNGNIDAKCVPPEMPNTMKVQIYILSTAIVISLLIVTIFIQVLRNIDVWQIISYTHKIRLPQNDVSKILKISHMQKI